ncbi:hypothetical protein BC830DRAFT_1174734 [Chytriomyces sp. MP71]|nr:hypothetical protein BC830DRAFT_1174734 [Chytriomyces sp. MP71]
MQRTADRLSELETRFSGLSDDGSDALQSVANWVLSQRNAAAAKTQLFPASANLSPLSVKELRDARASVLSVLRLLKALVDDMDATLSAFRSEYSHLEAGSDVLARARITQLSQRIEAYKREAELKDSLFKQIFTVQDSSRAMFFMSCWLHMPFVSDLEEVL